LNFSTVGVAAPAGDQIALFKAFEDARDGRLPQADGPGDFSGAGFAPGANFFQDNQLGAGKPDPFDQGTLVQVDGLNDFSQGNQHLIAY